MRYSIVVIAIIMVILPSGATGIETVHKAPAEQHYRDMTGTILYVGGSGPGNFSTIQQAVDNASDGDTVFVFDDASPYQEHVHVNASLTLLGENKNSTVIDGADYGDVLTINKTGVTVSGFTIRRNGWYDDGIVLHAPNAIIQGNKVANCGYAVKAFDVDNITITRNEFFEDYMGVSMYGAAGDIVANNTFNATYLLGIDLADSVGENVIKGNILIANTDTAIQSSYVGIRLWDSSNTIISHNTLVSLLDSCYGGIELWRSNNNIIQQNIFIKNGLMMYRSDQNVISETNSVNGKPLIFLKDEANKTVEDAGQVVLVHCERITVCDLVLSNLETGITLLNSTGCIVENNAISLCRYGISLEGSRRNTISGNEITSCEESLDSTTSASNFIMNNTIQGSTYYGIILNEVSSTISGNVIRGNPIGIWVSGKRNNKISGNLIENNSIGVQLIGTFHNTIEKNNFLRNTYDAFFDTAVNNHWRQNYWEKPQAMPKVIRGYLVTYEYYPPVGGGFVVRIPWINIDWHPASVPYEISFPSPS